MRDQANEGNCLNDRGTNKSWVNKSVFNLQGFYEKSSTWEIFDFEMRYFKSKAQLNTFCDK